MDDELPPEEESDDRCELEAGGKFYLEHYVKNHEEYMRRTARAVKLVEQVQWNC